MITIPSTNFIDLLGSDSELGNNVLNDPENSLRSWDKATFNLQRKLIEENKSECIIKNNVTCRISGLPPWSHISFTTFPGNAHTDKFIQVSGTVTRMSAKKALEYQRQYICSKCKYPIIVEASFERMNIIKVPKACTNPNGCTSKHIITFGELDPYNCKDYQEIKIQEDLSKPGIGCAPEHMIVILEDDLVDTCKPGENVTICGILKRRWPEFSKGDEMKMDIALKANHIQLNNHTASTDQVSDEIRDWFKQFWEKFRKEPLVGRSVILRSISPELYGLNLVKLGIAIVLAGGTHNVKDSHLSTDILTRSEPHILLVGDPGTGKSEMLRFASKIVKRSVLTTGVGSTAAGLTVSAVMEKRHWQLEAGALVMSDGGICCIDEFNSMKEHDRTSIHEAMEQQTISVAKGGIVCKLKTRCSILAACNPKGNIDLSQPLCVNVAMSSPLLSRFDLILLIKDTVNGENDKRITQNCGIPKDKVIWKLEKLQAYYAVIKTLNPKLSNDAETILSTYYQLQRRLNSRNKSRTTMRLLESLVRLSQGHAKLMFHTEVQVLDTIFAVVLVDAALDYDSSLLSLKVSNNAFCDDPETAYQEMGETVLRKLNLGYIWQRELEKNQSNLNDDTQIHNSFVSESLDDNTSESKEQRNTQQPSEDISKTQSTSLGLNASKIKKVFPKFASNLEGSIDDDMDLDLGNIWNSQLRNIEDTIHSTKCGDPVNESQNEKLSSPNSSHNDNIHLNKSTKHTNSENILNHIVQIASTSKIPSLQSMVSSEENSICNKNEKKTLIYQHNLPGKCTDLISTRRKNKYLFSRCPTSLNSSTDNDMDLDLGDIWQPKLKTNKNDTVDSGVCINSSNCNISNNESFNISQVLDKRPPKHSKVSAIPQHCTPPSSSENVVNKNETMNNNSKKNKPENRKSFPIFASKLDSFDDDDMDLDKPTNFKKILSQVVIGQPSTSGGMCSENAISTYKIDGDKGSQFNKDKNLISRSTKRLNKSTNDNETSSSLDASQILKNTKAPTKHQYCFSSTNISNNKNSFPFLASKLDSFDDDDMDLDKPTNFKKILSQITIDQTSESREIYSLNKKICDKDGLENCPGPTKKLKTSNSEFTVLDNIPSVNDEFSKFNIDFDISSK